MFGVRAVNLYFEIKVQSGFKINPFLGEKYRELCDALGLIYDPNNRFSPNLLFEAFNQHIPATANNNNPVKPYHILPFRPNVEFADRIYFIGWRNNNQEKEHVSDENLTKTRELLDYDAFIRCRERNISSRWSANANDEVDFYMPD